MSRLQTGALELVSRDVGLDEVVPAALRASARSQAAWSSTSPRRCRACTPMPRCSSGRSPTSSRTRCMRRRPTGRCGCSPARSQGRVELHIADEGPGIPRDKREEVFQPFQRLGDSAHGDGRRARARRRAGLRRGDGRRAHDRRHARRRHDRGRQPPGRARRDAPPTPTRARRRRRAADPPRARHQPRRHAATRSTSRETGEEALDVAARHHPDVVVLDLGLPGIDGVEVIEGLRGWSQVPIIVLSVRESEADKVAALDAGADDYVTKPFGMDELLARLRAALRRAAPGRGGGDRRDARLHHRPRGQARDPRRRARSGSRRPSGTSSRCSCATRASSSRSASCSQEVWGPQYHDETNYLRVFMAQVRRKLEPEPSRPAYFITEPGMGYRFEAPT